MCISFFPSSPTNWNLQGCAAPYLPPGGRCPSAHTGADEERRYVPYLYAFREKGTLEKSVPFELTALQMVRCRRSSSTASRSPFPPGEGIVRHSSLQTPICQCADESRQPERSIVSFSQHTARFAMCQAIFAMKFAKKYAIIVNVNKNRQFSSKNHSDLYNVHKNTVLIL